MAAGAAAGAVLRAAQLLFLQQTVPFTYRKHTLLLPVGIELLMGDATFKQQIGGYAQAGKVLKENNSDYQLIAGIAKRVINAVGKEYGGGFQSHVKKFKWEVVVVDDKVPNAFVLPGGKIVVFTGRHPWPAAYDVDPHRALGLHMLCIFTPAASDADSEAICMC